MKMSKRLKAGIYATTLGLFCLGIATIPTIANAEVKTVQVQTSFSDQELISILKEAGCTDIKPLEEKGRIIYKQNDLIYMLRNYGNTIQFLYFLEGDNREITLKKVNTINYKFRFLTATFNAKDDSMAITYDLDVEAGITKKSILDRISGFSLVTKLVGYYLIEDK